MDATSIRKVGVIGLGRMGLPMARHLVRAGFSVSGFDLDPDRRTALAGVGGVPQPSVGAVAAQSDAVLVMVANDDQVTEAALGAAGIVATAPRGAVVIVSSTVTPSTCRAVAATAATRGGAVLDAPVSLGQRAAEAGTLTVFAGGPSDVFARCRPVFSAFGTEIVHVGEAIGSGQVAKLVNNLILWAGIVAVREGLTLGEHLGVPPGRLRRALQKGSADSYALRALHLINLTWPQKDLQQAMDVAAELGVALPLAERVAELIQGVTQEDLRRLTTEE